MIRPALECRHCGTAAPPTPTGWDATVHTPTCVGVLSESVILNLPPGVSEERCPFCDYSNGHYAKCGALDHDPRFDAMSPDMQERFGASQAAYSA